VKVKARAHVDRGERRLSFGIALALALPLLGAGVALGCDPDVKPTAEAECTPGERRCTGNTPEVCGSDLQWKPEEACSGEAPFCVDGACAAEPPSCADIQVLCGPDSDESCCRTLPVTGGNFKGGVDPDTYNATVNDFELDRFEVTVGRFRQFVAAYPESKPQEGAGAHPLIAGSGWSEAWDEDLPATQEALIASVKCSEGLRTWTDVEGPNESLPINCLSWSVAFAFCAWDNGRLPTNAEWNYAAAGGSQQLNFPWGNDPGPGADYAVYDCMADGSPAQDCGLSDIPPVGSVPLGDGKYGQADLSGSMYEWALDWFGPYSATCANCANIDNPNMDNSRTAWGGDWSHDVNQLFSYHRFGFKVGSATPNETFHGVRCARDP
jgi:sulfatase modifying factor 1